MKRTPVFINKKTVPFPTPKSRVLELNGPPQKIITYREYSEMLKGNWLPPSWV